MKIAGIPRNPENSPNMSDKDMLLFNKIVEELREKGHTVKILTDEDNFSAEYDAIFHMTRNTATLDKLTKCEKKGVYIINPVEGVKNCSREKFVEIFNRNNIKQPSYLYINTSIPIIDNLHFPGWIKNSKGWSCSVEDVQFVKNEEEYKKALFTLAAKGCKDALFFNHIAGDIIKFYGIQDEDFFRWYYPDPTSTKFGLEKINGKQQKYQFKTEKLRKIAFQAAKALNIKIFGGDCIITREGEIYIIDLNDFPSFTAYRDEAAKKIATTIVKKDEKNRTRSI